MHSLPCTVCFVLASILSDPGILDPEFEQPELWKRLHSLQAFYEDVPPLELVLSMVPSDVSLEKE